MAIGYIEFIMFNKIGHTPLDKLLKIDQSIFKDNGILSQLSLVFVDKCSEITVDK